MFKNDGPIYSMLNGEACCGGSISLSGATRGNGCYTLGQDGGFYLDTRVLDEEGNRTSGTIYYAYANGNGCGNGSYIVSFEAYDITDLFWYVNGPLGVEVSGVCPPVGTFVVEQYEVNSGTSNINLTISCGC